MTTAAFYVYVIEFDNDVYGIFSTRAEAIRSLNEQIEEGGPAWEDCSIERRKIEGEPEVEYSGDVDDNRA